MSNISSIPLFNIFFVFLMLDLFPTFLEFFKFCGNFKKCPFTYWLNGRWFLQIVDIGNFNMKLIGRWFPPDNREGQWESISNIYKTKIVVLASEPVLAGDLGRPSCLVMNRLHHVKCYFCLMLVHADLQLYGHISQIYFSKCPTNMSNDLYSWYNSLTWYLILYDKIRPAVRFMFESRAHFFDTLYTHSIIV